MKRRTLLGAAAGSAAAAAGGVALFKPEIIVGSTRGEGEALSTERSSFEGTVESRPGSERVRWSRAENPDGRGDYTTEPFADWASRRAYSAAGEAARVAVDERIDGEIGPFMKSISHEYVSPVVMLQLLTLRKRNGEVKEPKISLDTLVDAAPRSVEATVRLAGRSHTERVPVFADETSAAQ